ncbi:MAG: hypothetical protein ACJAW3_000888 [Lentimonas sp.]|jgi:hypothetical protein
MMIASMNPISIEGRSDIIPALMHMLDHHKMKHLLEYCQKDFEKIITHWIKTEGEVPEQFDVLKISQDFVLRGKVKKLDLRSLKKEVLEILSSKEAKKEQTPAFSSVKREVEAAH